jgi:predicted nucleic acid-binding protein
MTFLSNPEAFLFDSSIIIAMLNLNPSENGISDQVLKYVMEMPQVPRLTVSPCFTEIFYKCKKAKVPPEAVRNLLEESKIYLIPIAPDLEHKIFEAYAKYPYRAPFDFADFSICMIGVSYFEYSQVLTLDRNDMPIAVGTCLEKNPTKHLEAIPFPR